MVFLLKANYFSKFKYEIYFVKNQTFMLLLSVKLTLLRIFIAKEWREEDHMVHSLIKFQFLKENYQWARSKVLLVIFKSQVEFAHHENSAEVGKQAKQ